MNLQIPLRRVIIESPYSGNITVNKLYLADCIRDSILHGEAPFASHQMYPGALRDSDSAERQLGIAAGFAWWPTAEFVAFYLDLGLSPGMEAALARCRRESIIHCFRSLHGQAELETAVAKLPDMASSLTLAVQLLNKGSV